MNKAFAAFLIAVPLSFFSAVVASTFMNLAFDWGYALVDYFFGQPSQQAQNQGWLVILGTPAVVIPMFFGSFAAFFKTVLYSSYPWRPAIIVCLTIGACCLMLPDTLQSLSRENVVAFVSMLFTACLTALLSFRLTCAAFGKLSGLCGIRTKDLIESSYASVIWLVPVGLHFLLSELDVIQKTPDFRLEAVAYGFFIFVASAMAVRKVRHTFPIAATLSALPLGLFVVMSLLNVVMTGVSLGLDSFGIGLQLGWRALLSATLIAIVTVGATVGGTLAGRLGALHRARAEFNRS